MPKKRKTATSTAKSEKLWIEETLKRLRALKQMPEPKPAKAAVPKPPKAAAPKPRKTAARKKARTAPRRASRRKPR